MLTKQYVLRPLDDVEADRLRSAGGELTIADESPGFPCRSCLRDAAVGETMLLTQYDPFDPFTNDSPYRSPSPVFVHADQCPAWTADELPESLTRRKLSVRGFGAAAQMLDARIIDGGDLDATALAMLADPNIERLHVHNAAPGCWAVTITRRDDRR